MSKILPVLVAIIVVLGIAGSGGALLYLTKPVAEQAEEQPAGLSIFAEPIVKEDLVFNVEAQGEVTPQRETVLAAQVSGRISFISPDFIDGGFIRKGQVLVRLEDADYRLGVTRARSGVASAEQRLAREQAEAELAVQDLETLGIENSSPLARREPQLAEAQAALDSANAQLQDAELALSRTAIRAPFTGRVREASSDIGQFASPGMSMGRIFATDVVEVSMPITDDQLGQLGLPLAYSETASEPGPDVKFTGRVGGVDRTWIGRITRTAATVNPRTRFINIIAELADPYGKGADRGAPMAPGLFVEATIEGTRIKGVFKSARTTVRSGNTLYIADTKANQLRLREVEVVFSSPEGVWFRSDETQVGELAITSPIQAPFDGLSITILERKPDGTIYTHQGGADVEVEVEKASLETEGVQ